MQIHVYTDNHVISRESLVARAEAEVEGAVGRFAERITRVEVHLGDENGAKHGANDKRCLIEVKPAGHPPIAASHHAASLDDAISGAADKLEHALSHALDRLDTTKGRTSFSGQPT